MTETSPEYRKYALDNGVTLVVESHPHVRSVALGVWVKVGSSYELPKENGISHFIEHMVFKGTTKRSSLEIATSLECLGGDLNAFTDRELTCFHATVLNEHVENALDVLSDLVLHPMFDKNELERERRVLLQELSMVEETPDDWINDLFFQSIWKGHPLGQPIIGSRKNIQSISKTQLSKYFGQHYRPDNIVVSVAGNVDPEKLRHLVEKYFQFSDEAQKPLPLKPLPTKYRAKKRVEAMNIEQLHLLLGFEGIGFRHDHRFDALILSFFLGGGMSSRLFQEIRERAALAYSVDCDFVPFSDTGVFTIYAAMAPKSLKSCLKILSKEIHRLIEQPLTQFELGLVKGQIKGSILMGADQMDMRQESLGRNEIIFGRYVPVEEVIEEIQRVTAERIQVLAKRLFVPEKESIVTVGKLKTAAKQLTVF